MASTDLVVEKKKVARHKTIEPSKYKVIICNDDVTPVEFVVAMLIEVFKHAEAQAIQVTKDVHNKGSAVAGVYSYEVAEQRGLDGAEMARNCGYPLIIKIEEE